MEPIFAEDLDITYAEYPSDIESTVRAAIETLQVLEDAGLAVTPSPADADAARSVFLYGEELPFDQRQLTAGATKHLRAMLEAYDEELVRDATQMRRYVTNRLIEESNNKDARVRMRALELLGKLSDVGLFTEKSEVTYKNFTVSDIEAQLREKLTKITSKLAGNKDVSDAVVVDNSGKLLTAPQEVSEVRTPKHISVPGFDFIPK